MWAVMLISEFSIVWPNDYVHTTARDAILANNEHYHRISRQYISVSVGMAQISNLFYII